MVFRHCLCVYCVCAFISILDGRRIALTIHVQIYFLPLVLYTFDFFLPNFPFTEDAPYTTSAKCTSVTDWIERRTALLFASQTLPFPIHLEYSPPLLPLSLLLLLLFFTSLSIRYALSTICKFFSMILIHDYDNDYDCNIKRGGKQREACI